MKEHASEYFQSLEPRLLLSYNPSAYYMGPLVEVYHPEDYIDEPAGEEVGESSPPVKLTQQVQLFVDNDPIVPQLIDSGLLKVDAYERLRIYVVPANPGSDITSLLENAGLVTDASSRPSKIIGWADATTIAAISQLSDVQLLGVPAPASLATNQAGIVGTIGEDLLLAEELRNLMQVDGTGVRVGVISDGITDRWIPQTYGDLPDLITFAGEGLGNEGTAMLEIVHDLAPGADLYFAPAQDTDSMVDAINWMVDQGVDVIVDDMTFYITDVADPNAQYFNDGLSDSVAMTAAQAVSDGIVYVTCAGNWQRPFDQYYHAGVRAHWQGNFINGGSGWNDFDPVAGTNHIDLRNDIYIQSGATVWVNLQWNEEWGTSNDDYDIFLYNEVTNTKITGATSELRQNGDDAPWEGFQYTNNTGSAMHASIRIKQIANRDTTLGQELEVFVASGFDPEAEPPPGCTSPQWTTGDSLASQQAVESVLTVGALYSGDVSDPPAYQNINTLEPFSSNGPSRIWVYHPAPGQGFEPFPVTRSSLDVVAVDGVDTLIGLAGWGNPFFGTSAAAPHIAAIAALMKQVNPNLSPAEVQDAICDSAVDVGYSDLYFHGYDSATGHGLVNAAAIADFFSATPAMPVLLTSGSPDQDGITNKDNTSGKALTFSVLHTVSGATIRLYADGDILIGTGTGNGGTITIATNEEYDLTDGSHTVISRQTAVGMLESASSGSASLQIDTVAPTVQQVSINENTGQRSTLAELALTFSESVIDSTGALYMQKWNSATSMWDNYDISGAQATYDVPTQTTTWKFLQGDPNTHTVQTYVSFTDGWYWFGLAGAATDLAGNSVNFTGQMFFLLAGDINGNGSVDVVDLGALSHYYDDTFTAFNAADLNYDYIVNVIDLGILSRGYDNVIGTQPQHQ